MAKELNEVIDAVEDVDGLSILLQAQADSCREVPASALRLQRKLVKRLRDSIYTLADCDVPTDISTPPDSRS